MQVQRPQSHLSIEFIQVAVWMCGSGPSGWFQARVQLSTKVHPITLVELPLSIEREFAIALFSGTRFGMFQHSRLSGRRRNDNDAMSISFKRF